MKTGALLSQLFNCIFFILGLTLSPSLFGQSYSIQDTVIARQLLDEAKQLTDAGKYEEAYAKADSARLLFAELLGERTKEVADAWDKMGYAKLKQESYAGAVVCFYNVSEILKNQDTSNKSLLFIAYNNLGFCFFMQEKFNEAARYYEKAVEILLQSKSDNPIITTEIYNDLGVCYYYEGNYELAEKYFNLALAVQLDLFGEEHLFVANTLNNLGAILNNKGDYDNSIKHKQSALKIRQKLLGNDHPLVAAVYNNLGISYHSKGDFYKAVQYKEKALAIQRQKLDSPHREIARSLNNIGNSYGSIRNYELAIQCKSQALSMIVDIVGENNIEAAIYMENLGGEYFRIGNYEKAKELFERALEIKMDIIDHQHPEIASSYLNLGSLHDKKGNFEKSLHYFSQALNIWINTFGNIHPKVADAILGKASNLKSLKQHEEAYKLYEEAKTALNYSKEETLESVNSVTYLKILFESLANTHLDQYSVTKKIEDLYKACENFKKTFEAETYLFNTISPSTKLQLAHESISTYEGAIQANHLLFKETKDPDYLSEAFTISERSKAYLLYESMHEADALHVAGIPDSLLAQEYDLRVDLAYYDKMRQETLASGAGETDTVVLAISSKLFDVRSRHDALKRHFETTYPEYYRAKYDLSVISVEETQQELLRPGEALLEYFVGDSAIFVFVVRPDTFAVLEIPNDFALDSLVTQLRHGIYGYYEANKLPALYAPTAQQYTEAATTLYDKLIAPVQHLLPKRLYIVPDGVLGYVPFETLLLRADEKPERFHLHHYFGQDHIISYAYSATLLREMRAKKHRKEPKGNVLAMAPFFRGDVRRLSEAVSSGEALLALRSDTLKALPDSGEEALRIAKAYKGKSLIGKEATKAAFEREASDYRILHLSTHGVADDRVGDYAWLGFAKPGAQDQFEKLYVRDIYNLSLNADLVVLSACQAGIGKLQRGEGIISLSRAFAYAGAKGIVTTLWSVEDKKTKDFMLAFYGHLRKMPAAEALWQTRRDFLTKRTGEAAHPYFWAGFIGVGDM